MKRKKRISYRTGEGLRILTEALKALKLRLYGVDEHAGLHT